MLLRFSAPFRVEMSFREWRCSHPFVVTVLGDLILPQGLLAAALSRNLTPYVRMQRIFVTRLFPSPTSLNFTKSLKYSIFILQYLLIHSELL